MPDEKFQAIEQPDRKFLFVSGCPRSGTTILATLLNWSDEALVCQERYAPLLRFWPEKFSPELYERERLLRFEPEECGYPSFEAKREYHTEHANHKDFRRSDTYPFIGDKITHLYRRFGILRGQGWEDEQIVLLHTLRNPVDVALSYARRWLSPEQGWEWDHRQAVDDWIAAVERAFDFYNHLPEHVRFGLVDYDFMFDAGPDKLSDCVEGIFAFVGLTYGAKQRAGISKVYSKFHEYKAQRMEDSKVRDYVLSSMPRQIWERYRQLCEQSHTLVLGKKPAELRVS